MAGEKRELGHRTKSLLSRQAGGDGGVAQQLRGGRYKCDDKKPHQEVVQKEWVKSWLLSLEIKKEKKKKENQMMQFLNIFLVINETINIPESNYCACLWT